jgi:DNA polymerase III subunit epsilon
MIGERMEDRSQKTEGGSGRTDGGFCEDGMYLFFDTETTGIPRNYKAPVTDLGNWPRVVQLAFVLADSAGKELGAEEFLIKPEGFVIPADATRVHGITTERAAAEGVAVRKALEGFLGALASARALVAHNMAFDEKILGAEFLRAQLGNPLPKAKRLCTMEAGTNYCALPGRYGFKWPTLGELHRKLFGKDVKEAHAALADVRSCAACFFEMRKRGIIGQ